MEGQNPIIIKKVKKSHHSGAHGGSWKVAYADFVTAMMAFFLLLWLITMVAPEKRARVANYFRNFSLFEKGGTTILDLRNQAELGNIMVGDGDRATESTEEKVPGNPAAEPAKKLEDVLAERLEKELGDVKDQVMIREFEGGVRIELMDSEGSPMFASGRSELLPEGKRVLKVLSKDIIASGTKLAIEGHTDGFVYQSKQFSNWELSTDRASAARRELEADGLKPDQLLRVAGFAATMPLIKENPLDARNRRITLVLFTKENANPPANPKAAPLVPAVPALVQPPDNSEFVIVQDGANQGQDKMVGSKLPIDPVQSYLFGR